MQWFLDAIRGEEHLELVGVHSHLGSTIKKVRAVFEARSPPAAAAPPPLPLLQTSTPEGTAAALTLSPRQKHHRLPPLVLASQPDGLHIIRPLD